MDIRGRSLTLRINHRTSHQIRQQADRLLGPEATAKPSAMMPICKEVNDTERHLIYVACTRARDHLLVTGVAPAAEFLDDLMNRGGF